LRSRSVTPLQTQTIMRCWYWF